MSEKLYIALASEDINEFPEMVKTLKDNYPGKNWIETTGIYSKTGETLINGKRQQIRLFIQKFETL